MAASSAVHFQSCKSTNKKTEAEVKAEAEEKAERQSFSHPKEPTVWATRVFVSTGPEVTSQKVAECMEQVRAVGKDASNQDDMRQAISQTKILVNQDLAFYHMCFYHIAADLDDRLAQGGVLITDMATQFFDTMKALWIMARALDSARGDKDYFYYVRDRYIQISRDTFGRSVTTLGAPFDEKRRPGGGVDQTPDKPAGQALENDNGEDSPE